MAEPSEANEALWDACRRQGDRAPAAKAALEAGADPDVPDPYGRPALHLALMFGKLKVAKAILDGAKRIDVNARDTQDNECSPALIHAARAGADAKLVAAILERGADATAVDGGLDKATALHHAILAKRPKLDVVKLLVDRAPALLHARDGDGCTPLHRVCKSVSGELSAAETEIAVYLMAKGADVNARAEFGGTPLHFAVQSGGLAVVEELLKRGADVLARDDRNAPVLGYAFHTNAKNTKLWDRIVAAGHPLDASLLEEAESSANKVAIKWLKSKGVKA